MHNISPVYQHTVKGWNYATGIVTEAVFMRRDEAETFQSYLGSQGYSNTSYEARMGVSPLGVWDTHFDIDLARQRLGVFYFGGPEPACNGVQRAND